LNNINLLNYDNWVFADETRVESHRTKLYRMRKKSKKPKRVGIYNPNRFKLNIWGAISANGACKFQVSQILFKIIWKNYFYGTGSND
jgi:hypothetical protein